MGFVCLPIMLALYWLMLRSRKGDPYPMSDLIGLLLAGAASIVLSTLITVPLTGILSIFRLGIFSDPARWAQAFSDGSAAVTELAQEAVGNLKPSFVWNLIDMFFTAGLLEEGVKFATCRLVIRKEGMVRTWIDSVAAFAIVGITFELIENVIFGMDSDLISAIVRSLGCAHFVFGVIMGYFYGKYLVSGQKKYRWLSLWVPVAYHTITNALMVSMDMNDLFGILGQAAGISHILAAALTVCIVIRWQKNKTLDMPIKSELAS